MTLTKVFDYFMIERSGSQKLIEDALPNNNERLLLEKKESIAKSSKKDIKSAKTCLWNVLEDFGKSVFNLSENYEEINELAEDIIGSYSKNIVEK